MSFTVNRFHFIEKPEVHHAVNTFVDSFYQFIAVPKKCGLDDVEIAVNVFVFAESGVGLACLQKDFNGALQSSWILSVNDFVIFRVNFFDFRLQSDKSAFFINLIDFVSRFGRNVGNQIESVAYRIYEKPGAAGHHNDIVLFKQFI